MVYSNKEQPARQGIEFKGLRFIGEIDNEEQLEAFVYFVDFLLSWQEKGKVVALKARVEFEGCLAAEQQEIKSSKPRARILLKKDMARFISVVLRHLLARQGLNAIKNLRAIVEFYYESRKAL